MALLKLTFLLMGIALVSGAVIDSKKVKDYENFLRKSVTGTYQEPLTPELEELQNYEERSGKFQGDIVLTEEQIQYLVNDYSGARNSVTHPEKHWPGGVIPYMIVEDFFTDDQIHAIERAIDYIEEISCVDFVLRTTEEDYVAIVGGDSGCYSNVGRIRDIQFVNLQPAVPGSGCFRNGTIVHELLHSVGFFHQHATHNRDDWVDVIWNKIRPSAVSNFEKLSVDAVTNFDVEYDYGSVLHYSEYAFSIDGSKTLVARQPTTETIGQRVRMSPGDIRKLNLMYNCPL